MFIQFYQAENIITTQSRYLIHGGNLWYALDLFGFLNLRNVIAYTYLDIWGIHIYIYPVNH